MEKPSSPGDEFVLYILGKMYYRHIIVMTGQNIWCTIENHHNMSIQELLEVCSVHLVYLGKHQYGVIKCKYVNVEPLNVQQIRQRRQNFGPAMYNRSYNYSRVQSRPLNLTTQGTCHGRGTAGPGRGNYNFNYGGRLNQSHQRINPVSVLSHGNSQPPQVHNNAGLTFSSVFVSPIGASNEPKQTNVEPVFKHPEVAQVVQGLLNRENIQPSVNRGWYKHPEVEEVVSRLLSKRNTTALVDLTNEVENDTANKDTPSPKTNVVVNLSHSETSSDIEKDIMDGNIVVLTETGKSNIVDKHSIAELPSANETVSVEQETIPDIPERNYITTEVSSNTKSENASEKLDNTIQKANLFAENNNEKPAKEIGELLSSDDCSTSNTTDKLLEELGINERVTQSPVPVPVNNVTCDLMNKHADSPISSATGDAAVQVKTDKPVELETNDTACKKAEPTSSEPTPTSHDDATAPTSENVENNGLLPRPELSVKTELDEDMPDITDCSQLKSNELEENTQFTFHMLQEQIQQLQCKIETKDLTCVDVKKLIKTEQVKFSSD